MASLSRAPTFTSTPLSRTAAPSTSALSYILFLSAKKSRRKLTAVFCSAKPRRARPDYVPNRISDPLYVRVFDTTLRDGEQSPGASMTSKEKLDIARQLFKLGVDIIEAGFPAASKDDLEAVKMIAKEVGNEIDENGYVCRLDSF